MSSSVTLRLLGKSELAVTPIGLGCWQFSKRNNMAGKFWPSLDDQVVNDIVKASLDLGINWFDTAEVYGNGASEKGLSDALQKAGKKPGEIIIATKWWPMFRFASNIPRSIGARLRALSPFPIDLYQVHQPFGFSSATEEVKQMAELVKEKHIRYVGVSNFSEQKMREAAEELDKQGLKLISNQVKYNLLDRRIEQNGVMKAAKELGVSIIAYSPLAQGILTGKFHDNPELLKSVGWRKSSGPFKAENMKKSLPLINLLKELGAKYKVSPAQVSLNWLLYANGDTVVAIPGATKLSHAQDNAGAMRFQLTKEEIHSLSTLSEKYTM
ncbi:MAG: aldo/keto reductase [Bacteroidales bacterium]|nr:aldo/keto reductase [Bacteroidales bacterium]